MARGTPEPLRTELINLLGEERVLARASDLIRYASDASPYRRFQRAVVEATTVPAVIHHMRIEKFGETCTEAVQVVTARALAPLKTLCVQAFPFVTKGAIALFPKGQDVEAELTDAAKYWRLQASRVPSRTSPDGSVLVIRALESLRES